VSGHPRQYNYAEEEDIMEGQKERTDWPFFIVSDPQGAIFRKYAVESGGILKYLHPAGMIAAIKAVSQGFRNGKFEGKETQLSAAFAVNSMRIITYVYYGKHISDLPSPATLAANME
jgi:thioredoxin-dependent peroxiredoxin